MSRFLKIAVVLLAIAAMATPVMAEDMLSLSGYYTLRGYAKDNKNWNDDINDSTQYFYQRLRLGGTFAVADGVSVHFRADIAEGTTAGATSDDSSGWDGTGDEAFGANAVGNIQFDRAYAKIEKDAYTIKAGQYGGGFGNAMLLDMTRTTAITVTLNDINLALEYHKLYEGNTAKYDDADLYMVTWGMANDTFSLDLLGGYAKWGGSSAFSLDVSNLDFYMAGANAIFNLGAFKINTEVDYLTGTEEYLTPGAADTDLNGLQFYADASVALAENFTLGGAVVYALGYTDSDEEQITGIGNDFEPEEYGYMATIMGGAYEGNALDPAGNSGGVMSGQLYASFKVADSLGLKGSVTYAEPEDDKGAAFDSFLVAGASARYNLAANTTVDVQYLYSQPDGKAGQPDDPRTLAACRLTVSF